MANKFIAKILNIISNERVIVLNVFDANRLNLTSDSRVSLTYKEDTVACIVNITDEIVSPGYVGIYKNLADELHIQNGAEVFLSFYSNVEDVELIKKKIRGEEWTKEDLYRIISDITTGKVTSLEIIAFTFTQLFVELTPNEIEYLARAIAESGKIMDYGEPVFNKHSIGGVPGNKVTLLIVPIVAAVGLLIPKTSSRAITSPSGTADTMEVLANVTFNEEELKSIAKKVRGAIVWGGGLNLAPADDIIIKVKKPLSIDPVHQMMASIMAKKYAEGTSFLVLDIPVGAGTKVRDINEGHTLGRKFVELGERLGIRTEIGITYGEQPVGHAIGPALEAQEALYGLRGKGPSSLIEKSTALAGILLELGGIASRGHGKSLAKEILSSGKAYAKMKEIIEEQGGNPSISPEDIAVGRYKLDIKAPIDGYVTKIINQNIKKIAVAAGAPSDKGAGIYLYKKVGYAVNKGEKLYSIYAESSTKLDKAYSIAVKNNPIIIEGMLLSRLGTTK